ncbi:hypothetical protein [Sporolactobacillus terrae]|uniref:hypothetical protein n=1 Tax=Sporolactobacillus terrae TaxID=269673 RepID=UPI00056AD1F7|nr:hypothetical protein [Sporolactobacillus terrae]
MIDYNQLFSDAARYLQVYDTDLILSWTQAEYQSFIRGAQHRQADELDRMAMMAMFNRYGQNAKHPKKKRMFDAEKAHWRIDKELGNWKESRTVSMPKDMYKKFKAGLNKSIGTFAKKGG